MTVDNSLLPYICSKSSKTFILSLIVRNVLVYLLNYRLPVNKRKLLGLGNTNAASRAELYTPFLATGLAWYCF